MGDWNFAGLHRQVDFDLIFNENCAVNSQCHMEFGYYYGSSDGSKFGGHVELPPNLKDCSNTFAMLRFPQGNYNISDKVTNCYQMFYGLMTPGNDITVRIGKNVVNCRAMFAESYDMNCAVYFPYIYGGGSGNLRDCSAMFEGCLNFNREFNMPEGVTNCAYMLSSCSNYNQFTVIPSTVTNVYKMFDGCDNFASIVRVPTALASQVSSWNLGPGATVRYY